MPEPVAGSPLCSNHGGEPTLRQTGPGSGLSTRPCKLEFTSAVSSAAGVLLVRIQIVQRLIHRFVKLDDRCRVLHPVRDLLAVDPHVDPGSWRHAHQLIDRESLFFPIQNRADLSLRLNHRGWERRVQVA